MENSQEKLCKKCGEIKNISLFAKNKFTKDLLRVYCKECDKKYREKISEKQKQYFKEYYKNNKDVFAKKNRKWIEDNREKYNEQKRNYFKTKSGKLAQLNKYHKRRAKIKDSCLSVEKIKEIIDNTKKCYWCGSLLKKGDVHIDHYTPLSKGGTHTIENIVVSCPKCNLSKGNKDPYEFAISKNKLC